MIHESPTRLVIVGAGGRMGRRLVALSEAADDLAVAAAVDHDTAGLDSLEPGAVDCVIDFSVHGQAPITAAWCATWRIPLVLGTTGLSATEHEAIAVAWEHAPVVMAANFSIGVNALLALASRAAKMLGDAFDLEVVEAHHRRKVDAPSGTARRIGEVLAEARGWSYDEVVRPGRDGQVGQRPDREIGMSVVRGGDVVGDHSVLLLGTGEQLVLRHQATDRDIFVRGALAAARWVVADRPVGLYGMGDVLGA